MIEPNMSISNGLANINNSNGNKQNGVVTAANAIGAGVQGLIGNLFKQKTNNNIDKKNDKNKQIKEESESEDEGDSDEDDDGSNQSEEEDEIDNNKFEDIGN